MNLISACRRKRLPISLNENVGICQLLKQERKRKWGEKWYKSWDRPTEMNFGRHVARLVRSRQCFLSLPLVHLLNLYPCALLLFSSWLLSYCHPCPRIAARRNDRNREISRKAYCSAGIKLFVWVDGAGNTLWAIKPNLHYWLIRIYWHQSLLWWPPPQMNGILGRA